MSKSLIIAALLAGAGFADAQTPTIRFTPFTLRTYDGQTHELEIGKIRAGARDTVAFYRLRSRSEVANAPPTVFLMGGPGIPATVMAPIPPYWAVFDKLREFGDVIVLDQRGLGLSSPKVDCPPLSTAFDTAFLTSHAALVASYRKVAAACAEYWRSKGVDPRQYSDIAIAEDIERIRIGLRAAKVRLLGFSYGTRLAMTYARRYPRNVESMVLQGPTDAELEYHESLQRDSLLLRMATMAAKDTFTAAFAQNLVPRIRALIDRAGQNPIRVKIRRAQGDSVVIPVGGEGLRGIVEGHITDTRLPAFIATTENDDLTILTQWVEGMYNDFGGGAGTLMARAMNCSAPASAARRQHVDSLAKRSLFGVAFDNFAADPEFCSALGGEPPAIQPRLSKPIAARVFFITGELDDRTPPGNDAVLAGEFTSSTRLVVANGGHELLPMGQVQNVVMDFFAGADVSERTVRDVPRVFMPIEIAKVPPRRIGQ